MKKFLSCDWGTSAFRLRLVEMESVKVLVSENSAQGISQTFQAWQKAGASTTTRWEFYQNIITDYIRKLEKSFGESLDKVPLVISGMASSSIGMMELSYGKFPFALDGSGIETKFLQSTNGFPHDLLLISGNATDNDMMRGEETMLMGCPQEELFTEQDRILFPGTHSKHITLKGGQAIEVKTYMTGEFFDLLSRQSILSAIVTKNEWTGNSSRQDSFRLGVTTGIRSNLLNSAFSVRALNLLHRMKPEDNYHYLSGLLIGSELQDLEKVSPTSLMLVSDAALGSLYEEALEVMGIKSTLHLYHRIDASDALIRGQLSIYRRLMK